MEEPFAQPGVKSGFRVSVEIVITRKDGTVEDLGVVSEDWVNPNIVNGPS